MEIKQRYRKLHAAVSEELFQKIKQRRRLKKIDTLLGNLLSQYFDRKEVAY